MQLENKGVESLAQFGGIQPGHEIGKGEILFSRLNIPKKLAEITGIDPEAEKKAQKEAKKAEKSAKKEKKKAEIPEGCISIDEFAKVEMTVCKVQSCENVSKSEKLLMFQLDDGSGTPRQILSGIAKYYKAEDLVGKTVVACTNLPPRKMMGHESNGMIISAVRETEDDEQLHLLMLDDKIPAGFKLC